MADEKCKCRVYEKNASCPVHGASQAPTDERCKCWYLTVSSCPVHSERQARTVECTCSTYGGAPRINESCPVHGVPPSGTDEKCTCRYTNAGTRVRNWYCPKHGMHAPRQGEAEPVRDSHKGCTCRVVDGRMVFDNECEFHPKSSGRWRSELEKAEAELKVAMRESVSLHAVAVPHGWAAVLHVRQTHPFYRTVPLRGEGPTPESALDALYSVLGRVVVANLKSGST